MRITTLGPLAVDGKPVGGKRLAAVIRELAEAHGRTVSPATLMDAVWQEDLPQDGAAAVQALTFYLDAISRTLMEHWTKGRVARLGDAAYGNTLGGFGTGMAIVGAYVLAGELHRSGGNFETAYAQYEAKFRRYAKSGQTVSGGTVLAPRTSLGMWARNRLFSVSFLFQPMMKLFDRFATDIELEDYTK